MNTLKEAVAWVDYGKVPAAHMVEGVRDWIEDGVIGEDSFLWAIMTNNLYLSFAKADHINIDLIREWATFVHWEVPGACQGSIEKVEEWARLHKEYRTQ